MQIARDQITGLLLAGGRATRMGGVDKGLVLLDGQPMAGHVLQRLQPQVGTLLINANRNLDAYRQLGTAVLPDQLGGNEGFFGPLAGLHAGLLACTTRYLLTAPCDAPLLPLDLVERLSRVLIEADADVAVAVTQEDGRQRRQPVFMLLHTSLLPQLSAALDAGCRKVDEWLRSLRCAEAVFDEPAAFINVNTHDELDRLGQSLPAENATTAEADRAVHAKVNTSANTTTNPATATADQPAPGAAPGSAARYRLKKTSA